MKLTQYNDPIYGFITIPTPLIAELINHPYVQRLRRIKQMGLSFLVFPSTEHTRFQHALGAMHLATKAVTTLRNRQVKISDDEAEALYICMLLHDLGHGPFSHALEHVLMPKHHHEDISIALMQKLNAAFDGKLALAIEIFTNSYSRKFFYQLVSSQIDLDRLDYLKRDSFFSGVLEGNINSERMISMMTVKNDELFFSSKAVYSIEKFLLARRMMYWSVYLHKTSFIAEEMLVRFFSRAITLTKAGALLKSSDALTYFLQNQEATLEDGLHHYVKLDDADVWMMLKEASSNKDRVLSSLANMILNRKLLKIEFSNTPFTPQDVTTKLDEVCNKYDFAKDYISNFVFAGSFHNQGYTQQENPIQLCNHHGMCHLFDSSPDVAHFPLLTKKDSKYFLAFPKGEEYFY